MGRRFTPRIARAISRRLFREPGTRCVHCDADAGNTHLLCGTCVELLPQELLAEYQARRLRYADAPLDSDAKHNYWRIASKCRKDLKMFGGG